MAQHESLDLAGQGAIVSRPTRASRNRLLVLARGGSSSGFYAYVTSILYGVDVAAGEVTWNDFNQPMRDLIDFLAERGYVVVSPMLYDSAQTGKASQGAEFGNDASTTQLANVITAAQALPGVGAGKYGLLSFSMGSATISNYVRRFGQTNVAGMLSFCPLSNLSVDFRGTDAAPASLYAAVNLSHGIGGAAGTTACDAAWAPIAAVKEPYVIAASVTIPWGLWTNDNDALTPSVDAYLNPAIPAQYRNRRAMGNGSTAGTIAGHDFSRIVAKDVHDYLDTWAWG